MKTTLSIFVLFASVLFCCKPTEMGSNKVPKEPITESKKDSLSITEKFILNKLQKLNYSSDCSITKPNGLQVGDEYLGIAPSMVGQLFVLDTVDNTKRSIRTLPLYILKSNNFITTEIITKDPVFNFYTSIKNAGSISAFKTVEGDFNKSSLIGISYKTIYSCSPKSDYADLPKLDSLMKWYGLYKEYGKKLKIISSVTVKEFEFVSMDSLSIGAKGNFSVVNVDGKMFFKQESAKRIYEVFLTYDEPVIRRATKQGGGDAYELLPWSTFEGISKGNLNQTVEIKTIESLPLPSISKTKPLPLY